MREYIVTCCSTADMSRTFMETNEVPFAMFHYQHVGKEYADEPVLVHLAGSIL